VALVGDEQARGRGWLDLWNSWDTPHYLEIARNGYDPAGDTALVAFFPLLPLLIRLGSTVAPPLVAGLGIAYLASLLAAVGLHRVAVADGGTRANARAAVLAMNVFPTAFAFVAPYTEPLFLALVTWSFLRARRDDWRGAAILGFLAGLARLQGVLLLPALAVEAVLRRGRHEAGMLWLLLVAAAPLVYLGINWWAYGDPLFFATVQREHFYHSAEAPWVVLGGLVDAIVAGPLDGDRLMLYVAPLAGFVVLAVATGWALLARRSRPAYAVYAGLTLASLAMLTWPISVPRYVLGAFPVFLAAGGLVGRWRRVGAFLLALSIALLATFLTQFALGAWAF